MFDQIKTRFSDIFSFVKKQGRITEKNISDALRDIRRAFLEADVNYLVSKKFIEKVRKRSIGDNVLKSITPGQQFIKIVKDELIKFLSTDNTALAASGA